MPDDTSNKPPSNDTEPSPAPSDAAMLAALADDLDAIIEGIRTAVHDLANLTTTLRRHAADASH